MGEAKRNISARIDRWRLRLRLSVLMDGIIPIEGMRSAGGPFRHGPEYATRRDVANDLAWEARRRLRPIRKRAAKHIRRRRMKVWG